MKLYKCIAVGITILILGLSLAGCAPSSRYEALQEENISLETNLEATQSELADLQASYNELETEKEIVAGELAEIKEVYPPQRFSDAEALEAWLAGQPNGPVSTDAILWLSHGLQLQRAALEDGYIINVELITEDDIYYSVYCTAVLEDNSYYGWDPETDDIYYYLNVKQF